MQVAGGTGMDVTRWFRLEEAQALLPEVRIHAARAVMLVDQLGSVGRAARAEPGAPAAPDALRHGHDLELELDACLAWFDRQGILVRGLAPVLLDFPARARHDGEDVEVLLCWRDDEDAIGYYHPPEDGYRARVPIAMLDRV